jgi:hypothetical protein
MNEKKGFEFVYYNNKGAAFMYAWGHDIEMAIDNAPPDAYSMFVHDGVGGPLLHIL